MNKIVAILIAVLFVSCQSGNKNASDAGNSTEDQIVQFVADTIHISGMHCDMCVSSIEKGVNEVNGIQSVKANLDDSVAVVEFDASKTKIEEIEAAIEKRGYSVKDNL